MQKIAIATLIIFFGTISSYDYKIRFKLFNYAPRSTGTAIADELYTMGGLMSGKSYSSQVSIVSSRDGQSLVKNFKTVVRAKNKPEKLPRKFVFSSLLGANKKPQISIIDGLSQLVLGDQNESVNHDVQFETENTLCVLMTKVSSKLEKELITVSVQMGCANEEAYDAESKAEPNSEKFSVMFRVNDKLF